MTTGDDSGSRSDQIDVDSLFEAQEKERRRRRGWIAAALVGVVAAGAVTGGVVTGAFTGDDADTDAADAPDALGASESASEEEPVAEPSESAQTPTSPAPSEDSASGTTSSASPSESAEDAEASPAATDDADADADASAAVPDGGASSRSAGSSEGEASEGEASEGEPSATSGSAPSAGDAEDTDDTSPAPQQDEEEDGPAPTSYAISSGDSLWSITEDALPGDPSDQAVVDTWPTIYEANRDVIGDDPNMIRTGEQLSIPDLSDGRSAAAPPATASRVVVEPGESLWSITNDALGGDASSDEVLAAWPTLYEANRQVIGDDPDLIRAGQELVVPPLR